MKVPSAYDYEYSWLDCKLIADYANIPKHIMIDKGDHFERKEIFALMYRCKYLW
jgi:hypothetical protein